MDPITTAKHFDQLRQRRKQVSLTLQHVDKERKEAEQNTDWLDQAAYESRLALLDRLTEWYMTEMDQIDKALERVEKNKYGLCLACHSPIEEPRLEFFPQTAFCSACQATREALQGT